MVAGWNLCESKYEKGTQIRKCYQIEWHGIPFDSFAELSTSTIADATFYNRFYKAFFEKYHEWGELDRRWVADKLSLAGFLINSAKGHKEKRILSIGCGLGIIEKKLIDEGYSNIEILEVSQEPMQWIKQYLPDSSIHVGFFPGCLPDDRCFDLICLPCIDYWFKTEDLVKLLKSVNERLFHGGTCLLFSASFDYRMKPSQNLLRCVKSTAKFLLDKLGLWKLGQFWGYIRSDNEFRRIMQESGFTQITDGLVDPHLRDNYWIQGTRA